MQQWQQWSAVSSLLPLCHYAGPATKSMFDGLPACCHCDLLWERLTANINAAMCVYAGQGQDMQRVWCMNQLQADREHCCKSVCQPVSMQCCYSAGGGIALNPTVCRH